MSKQQQKEVSSASGAATPGKNEYVYFNNQIYKIPVVTVSLSNLEANTIGASTPLSKDQQRKETPKEVQSAVNQKVSKPNTPKHEPVKVATKQPISTEEVTAQPDPASPVPPPKAKSTGYRRPTKPPSSANKPNAPSLPNFEAQNPAIQFPIQFIPARRPVSNSTVTPKNTLSSEQTHQKRSRSAPSKKGGRRPIPSNPGDIWQAEYANMVLEQRDTTPPPSKPRSHQNISTAWDTIKDLTATPTIPNDIEHADLSKQQKKLLRKQQLLRTVESDEDLVARIHTELDRVYEAVELGKSPTPDIWRHRPPSASYSEPRGRSRTPKAFYDEVDTNTYDQVLSPQLRHTAPSSHQSARLQQILDEGRIQQLLSSPSTTRRGITQQASTRNTYMDDEYSGAVRDRGQLTDREHQVQVSSMCLDHKLTNMELRESLLEERKSELLHMKNTLQQKALEVEKQQERLRAKELQLQQLEQKLHHQRPSRTSDISLQDEERIKLHIAQEMERLHHQLSTYHTNNTNQV